MNEKNIPQRPEATPSSVSTATLRLRPHGASMEGEIVSEARLDKYPWPETDPRPLPQTERQRRPDDDALILAAAGNTSFDMERLLDIIRNPESAIRVRRVLNHDTFRFNWRKELKKISIGQAQIEAACAAGRPVEIVIPYLCVIPNPVKRLEPLGPTVAEDVSILQLGRLSELVREVYPPGLTIHVVSDAFFYSPAYGVTTVEAGHYLAKVRERVKLLCQGSRVLVHDLAELLQPSMREFQRAFNQWHQAFLEHPLIDGLSQHDYDEWFASTRANINVQKLGLDYATLRAVFGPNPDPNHPVCAEVNREATTALAEYRAVKAAAAELKWEEKFFPGAIRATIHTKDVPVLGLRVYPEYKRSSKLLPYHGVALITPDTATRRPRMVVQPELFLRGRADLVRGLDESGQTSFYVQAGW